MRVTTTLRIVSLLSAFFIVSIANAQSPVEEIGPLPTALSTEQLQSFLQLSAGAPEVSQTRARRRLPRREPVLSPEEVTYKLTVQKLGVDKHRFVHCDLPNRKVRTGVITRIDDHGFVLKDGILLDQWISYTDLQAAPRPVPEVGTRIGQGFKWAGVGLGVAVLIPLFPFWFLFWDGC